MTTSPTVRYFLSYSSIKLPLNLVNEINEADLNHRNFYYRGGGSG